MKILDTYHKDTLDLTGSLLIKCSLSAYLVEKALNETIYEDRTTWRYYKHLAGEVHKTDKVIYIEDTRLSPTKAVLTLALVNATPWLKSDLYKHGLQYLRLVEEHPEYYLYFKGLVYQVKKQTAINAEDGTILGHRTDLIKPQEYSLIKTLNIYTTNYYNRWVVKEFAIVDSYYHDAFLAELFSMLPATILNARLSKMNTYEAHDYFMNAVFKGMFDIQESMKVLSREVRMWTFRNSDYIVHHIGKEVSLKSIVDNIATPSGVIVSEVIVRQGDPTSIIPTAYGRLFNTENLKFSVRNLATNEVGEEISHSYLLNKQMELVDDTTLTDNIDVYERKLKQYTLLAYNRTKSLIVSSGKVINTTPIDKITIALDILALYASTSTTDIVFTDIVTGTTHTMSPKSYFATTLDVLSKAGGISITNLQSYKATMLPSKETPASLTQVLNNAFLTDVFRDEIFPYFLSKLPTTTINDIDEVKTFSASIVEYYETLWAYESNTDNPAYTADIDKYIRLTRREVNLPLGYGDIDTYLINNDIGIKVTDEHNVYKLLTALMLNVTGIDIKLYPTILEAGNAIANILRKLTSYTTQILEESTNVPLNLQYANIAVIGDLNISRIDEAKLTCLEPNIGTVALELHSNTLISEGFFVNTIPELTVEVVDIPTPNGFPYSFIDNNPTPTPTGFPYIFTSDNTTPVLKGFPYELPKE